MEYMEYKIKKLFEDVIKVDDLLNQYSELKKKLYDIQTRQDLLKNFIIPSVYMNDEEYLELYGFSKTVINSLAEEKQSIIERKKFVMLELNYIKNSLKIMKELLMSNKKNNSDINLLYKGISDIELNDIYTFYNNMEINRDYELKCNTKCEKNGKCDLHESCNQKKLSLNVKVNSNEIEELTKVYKNVLNENNIKEKDINKLILKISKYVK